MQNSMDCFRFIWLIFILHCTLHSRAQDGIQNPNVRSWDNLYFMSEQLTPRSFGVLDSARFGISAAYHNFYSSGIAQYELASTLRSGRLSLGLGASYLSSEAYQYYEMSAHASQALGGSTVISAMLHYCGRRVAEFPSQSTLDGSIATRIGLSPKLDLQISVLHLYSLLQTQTDWNGLVNLGLRYEIIDRGTLHFIADKNKETPMSGRILFDYDFRRRFGFVTGYQFSPGAFMFGFDMHFNGRSGHRFDFLSSTHSVLGNNYSARYQYEN